MDAKKKHRAIYIVSFFVCAFTLIDTNYSPLIKKVAVVQNFECLTPRYRKHRSNSNRNYIGTKDHVYDLTMRDCMPVKEGDTIIVARSAITHALAFLAIQSHDIQYTADISFANGRAGKVWIFMILFMITVFFIFHDKLGNKTGKKNMAYFLFCCSLALLLQHILNIW